MSVGSLPSRKQYSERVEEAAVYYRAVLKAQSALNTVNAKMQRMLNELSDEEFTQWTEITVWMGGK